MIFLDTSALLALHDQRDQHHGDALPLWNELMETREPCFTSNLIVAEMLTLLVRRTDETFAIRTAKELFSSRQVTTLRPEPKHEAEALVFLRKLTGQRVSFVDCLSFALMRSRRIDRAFTFDRHFERAGFTLCP